MEAFHGKRIWITGASSGIGAALAKTFAKEGAKVGLAAPQEDRLTHTLHEVQQIHPEAIATPCDVTDKTSIYRAVDQMVDAFGGIDIAVANAGFGIYGHFTSLDMEDFRRQFDVNFFGLVETIYAVYPHLKATQGHLVCTSSMMGLFGYGLYSSYTATKFAVNGLCQCLYHDLGYDGISVTCVHPGVVDSNFARVDKYNVYHPEWEDTRPKILMVSAESAVAEILHGVAKRKPKIVLNHHGRLLAGFQHCFPALFRWLSVHFAKKEIALFRQKHPEGLHNKPLPHKNKVHPPTHEKEQEQRSPEAYV